MPGLRTDNPPAPAPTATRATGAVGLKLSATHRYALFAISFGVWITGVIWIFYHYFMQMESEFGVRKHWMEVTSLKIHGAFAIAATWLIGTLWWPHIIRGWNANWRRWSGGAIAASGLFLVITGWGLYYLVERDWREWTSLLHWIVGLACVIFFFVHWLSKTVARRP